MSRTTNQNGEVAEWSKSDQFHSYSGLRTKWEDCPLWTNVNRTKEEPCPCSQICRIMQLHYIHHIGEVAEWFKALAWKVSYEQLYAGSNPVFSANTKTIPKGFQKTVKLKWAGKYHFRQNAGIVCKTLCHATILGWLWNFWNSCARWKVLTSATKILRR